VNVTVRARKRYSRQTKLAMVGEAGQDRIFAASVAAGDGLSGWVAARYLAAAGVGEVRVGSAEIAEAARAVDASVRVVVDPSPVDAADARFSDLDPAAREVASGAHRALVALKQALRT